MEGGKEEGDMEIDNTVTPEGITHYYYLLLQRILIVMASIAYTLELNDSPAPSLTMDISGIPFPS